MNRGYLFDMAPDGFGYILDPVAEQSHVFAPKFVYPPPADWMSLEGREVAFSLWEGEVTRVQLM